MHVTEGNRGDEGNGDADQAGRGEIDAQGGQVTAKTRHDHAGQGHGRADRQVDQPANNDHGHAQGDDSLEGVAAQDVHPVRPGHEAFRPKGQADDQQDQENFNDVIEQEQPNLFSIKTHS